MLVDSHCHLDRIELEPFEGSFDKALAAAHQAGVEEFLCVAIDSSNQAEVIRLAEAYPNIYASAGIHPLNTEGQFADTEYLYQQAQHPKVIAIGETGLDFYYAQETREVQQSFFRTHIQAARRAGLPLIIHTRDARQETLQIMREEGADAVGGVLHCFTESLDMALAAIEMGFYISFSGILTFNNAAALREVAKQLPLNKILVETDSPYLTPVPYRGKPNSPRHVVEVARCLSELKGIDFSEVCLQTTHNYRTLFARH